MEESYVKCPKCGSEEGELVYTDFVEDVVDEMWVCGCGCKYVATYKLVGCEIIDD